MEFNMNYENHKFNLGSNWLTTTTVAKLLNLSVATIHKLVDKGALSGWKTQGGHRRILKSSLEDYVLKNKLPFFSAEKMSAKTHFALGSSDEIFLLHLKRMLIARADQCEYSDHGTLQHMIAAIYSQRPHVAVFDIELFEGGDAVSWLRSLREDHPSAVNMQIFLACEDSQHLPTEIRAIGLTHQIKLVNKDAHWLAGYFQSMIDRVVLR